MLKGTRVKYIHIDTPEDKETGFYPPIGTLGTVVYVDNDNSIEVKWDKGTDGDGVWWCEKSNVVIVPFQNSVERLISELMLREEFARTQLTQLSRIAQVIIELGYVKKEELK